MASGLRLGPAHVKDWCKSDLNVHVLVARQNGNVLGRAGPLRLHLILDLFQRRSALPLRLQKAALLLSAQSQPTKFVLTEAITALENNNGLLSL